MEMETRTRDGRQRSSGSDSQAASCEGRGAVCWQRTVEGGTGSVGGRETGWCGVMLQWAVVRPAGVTRSRSSIPRS